MDPVSSSPETRRLPTLVVVLAWVYYAAQIFLLGAEFTCKCADLRLLK